MPSEGGSLLLQPLPAAGLSPAVARLVGGATPAKLMAVRGMAPVRPAELLVAIYQLSFDAEPAVRTAAEAAPASFPDNVINPPLGEALPAPLLHFFAARLPDQRTAALERILYNPVAADETFLMLAGRLDESLLEIISQNEVRLLRCPAIVEALFFNKRARMSSVNRAVELCARNGVRLEGIPGFDEIVSAIRQDPEATDGAVLGYRPGLRAERGAVRRGTATRGKAASHRHVVHQVRPFEDLREDPAGDHRERLLSQDAGP